MTIEEIKNGLRYCKIRVNDLRNQAKRPRKTHLVNYLIEAQEGRDEKKVRAIKQKIDREHNVRMWYMIQCTVKGARSPKVLNVKRVENDVVHEYNSQEDVEQVVQKECKIRFNLAHKATIMKHTLAKKLRHLKDEEIAKTITEGTYEIPTDLNEPIKFILE